MLTDKINADLKQAMLAKDAARLSTLRLLKSAIEYHKIEKKQETLTDADVTGVIKKLIKQRQDSIEGFTKGGRADLVATEAAVRESEERLRLIVDALPLPLIMPKVSAAALVTMRVPLLTMLVLPMLPNPESSSSVPPLLIVVRPVNVLPAGRTT